MRQAWQMTDYKWTTLIRKPEGESLEKHIFRWKQNIQMQFSINSA